MCLETKQQIPLNIENVFKEENRLDNFCCQRILLFLLFLDTFRIQGVLLFLHFLDTFGSGPLRAEKREKFTRRNFTLPLGTLLDPLGTLLDLLGTLLDPLGTLLDFGDPTAVYWTLLDPTAVYRTSWVLYWDLLPFKKLFFFEGRLP